MAVPTGLKNVSSLNNFADFSGYLAGESPLASNPGGTYGEEAAQQSSREPSPAGPTSTQSSTQTSPTPAFGFDRNAGNTSAGLFNPIQQGLSASSQQLQNIGKSFREGAGQSRTFEGIGGTGLLDRSLSSQGGPEDIQCAKEMAGANYAGPTGLNTESTAALQNQLGQARDYTKSLTSGEGVTAALRAGGGLTPGESRFEAGTLMSDPTYQKSAREVAGQASTSYDNLLKEITSAQDFATQRAGEERGIATQTKDYLTGARSGAYADLDRTVAETNASDAKTAELYNAFQEKGDLQSLQDVAPDAARDFSQTPANQKRQEAERLYADIMAKYPDIANMPLGSMTVTPTGMETMTKPGEAQGGKAWYVQDPYDWTGGNNLADLAKSLQAQQAQRATKNDQTAQWVQRGREIGKNFSPGSAVAAAGYTKPGQYSDVMPITGPGEPGGYDRPDMRRFVEMDLGIPANRANMNTEDHRRVVNRVGEILGEAERLEKAGEPYRAAAVVANLDGFLEEETANLDAASKKTKGEAWKWVNTVKEVRRQYVKAKEKARWGKIIGGIGIGLSALSFGAGAPLLGGMFASNSQQPIWEGTKKQ